MKHSRTAIWASTSVLAVTGVVALVLLLMPGATTKPEQPAGSDVDLAADLGQFAERMSAESGYSKPSPAEREAIKYGVELALNGKLVDANEALAPVGYRLSKRVDTATKRTFYEVSESADRSRGWGRILIDEAATARLGVEVPHPKADLGSEQLGVGLFRQVPGSVLVIAGAHRRAAPDKQADMAHTNESVFETVHELLVQRKVPVMQLHGFRNETAPDSDVVVSAGPHLHSPYAEQTAQRLKDAGLSVCLSWVTGCEGLEATTNVQAKWVAEHGGDFVHVEVSQDTRFTAEARDRVVSALARQAAGR
ncbi:hypothetical protein [Amycolatopsis sp. MtRt-6]|uniref:hypothetical protein n=1 Tax=Amycolatopsis sp. MtRt-6 TaxID=2792782 RepID=UPI001A8D28B3|nr:hypothetical protein [Amycolatopsis sp. MtRt-6]